MSAGGFDRLDPQFMQVVEQFAGRIGHAFGLNRNERAELAARIGNAVFNYLEEIRPS